MFSKWQVWDFVQNHEGVFSVSKKGVYALNCYDAFIERLLLKKINKKNLVENRLVPIMGSEITTDWISEKIESLDLFAQTYSYIVLQSEELSLKVQNYLIEQKINWGDRYILFSFSKESKFFTKLAKSDEVTAFKINEPKFWDASKLLIFLADEFKIRLPYDVQNYIVENVENRPEDFINILKIISVDLVSNNKKVEVLSIKKLISGERLDQFALARLYSTKKRSEFYSSLFLKRSSFEEKRMILGFMQGHFYKMLDTSYIAKKIANKKKPTKYDKQIEVDSKLWRKDEIVKEMRLLSELELLAKSKSTKLDLEMKRYYLEDL